MALSNAGKSIVRLYERKDSFERLCRDGRVLTGDQLVTQFERQLEDEEVIQEQEALLREVEKEIDPLKEKHLKMKTEIRRKAKRFVKSIDDVAETKETQAVLSQMWSKQMTIARLEELKLKQILAAVPAAVKSDLFRTGEDEVDKEETLFLLLTKQMEIEQMVLQQHQQEVRPPKGIPRDLFRRALENNKAEALQLRKKLIKLYQEERALAEKYHWVRGTAGTERVREENNIFIGDEMIPDEVAVMRKTIHQVQIALKDLIHKKREDPEEARRKAKAAQLKRGSIYVFGSDYSEVVPVAGVLAERVYEELEAACNAYLEVRARCYWLEGTGTESEKTGALLTIAKSKRKELDDLLNSLNIDVEQVHQRANGGKKKPPKKVQRRKPFFQVSQKSLRRHPTAWAELPVDMDVYRVPKARDYFYLQVTRTIPALEKNEKGHIPDLERLRLFLVAAEVRMKMVDLYEAEKVGWVLTKRVQIGRPTPKRERNF
jgi:hypothetical protein